MARPVYLVNDQLTAIPGSVTLWGLLEDWLGSPSVILGPYPTLAARASEIIGQRDGTVIRNATYFGPLATPNCRTIVLLQDLMPPDTPARATQVEVCQRADVIVANSKWTLDQYPELAGLNVRVIPLPVDTGLFRPREDRAALQTELGIHPGSICWVGAADVIKGYDRLHRLAGSSDLHFAVVLKDRDKARTPAWFGRMRVFTRLAQEDLAKVMASCRVGLCTSRIETQHLAGLEMAASGLPVVYVDPVGVYAEPQPWAIQATEAQLPAMLASAQAQAQPGAVREALLAGPWSLEACRASWLSLVAGD